DLRASRSRRSTRLTPVAGGGAAGIVVFDVHVLALRKQSARHMQARQRESPGVAIGPDARNTRLPKVIEVAVGTHSSDQAVLAGDGSGIGRDVQSRVLPSIVPRLITNAGRKTEAVKLVRPPEHGAPIGSVLEVAHLLGNRCGEDEAGNGRA